MTTLKIPLNDTNEIFECARQIVKQLNNNVEEIDGA